MKEIILNCNRGIVLVDDEDFEELDTYSWNLAYRYPIKYAIRDSAIMMHRHILGVVDSKIHVDHRNGNGLDNQRHNLRIATPQQNQANSSKRTEATSIYKGVCWERGRKRWKAYIKYNYKMQNIGYFKNEIDAAIAYNKAAKRLFGEFASINIIKEQ